MKALSLDSPKNWKRIDVARSRRRPAPGEALVRVHRVGICGTDISGYLGKMPFFSYPRIPGHELGVEVLDVGAGVTNVQPGDRCSVEPYINCQECYACRRGHTNCCEKHQTLGVHCDGGLRPRFLVPARKLHVSRTLTFEQLALVETLAIGCHAVNRAGLQSARIVPDHRRRAHRPRHAGVRQADRGQGHHARRERAAPRLLPTGHGRPSIRSSCRIRVEQDLRDLTDGHLPDVVIDATGNSASMSSAFGFITHGGPARLRRHHHRGGALPPPDLPQARGHAPLLAQRPVGRLHADHRAHRGRPHRHRALDHASGGVRRVDRRLPVVHAARDRRHQGRRRDR